MSRRRVAAVVTALVVLLTTTPVAAASTNSLARSPLPTGAATTKQYASLNAVACSATNTCVAVGDERTATGVNLPFAAAEVARGPWGASAIMLPTNALSTTGTAASTLTELLGVSCGSATGCVAVGTYRTAAGMEPMVATETNARWSRAVEVALPQGAASTDQSAALAAVSCARANDCVAVGWYLTDAGDELPLALTESGGTWSTTTSPTLPTGALVDDQVAALASVSCVSNTHCVAVGGDVTADGFEPLVLTWQQGAWGAAATGVNVALPATAASPANATANSLTAVACWSQVSCEAVGQFQTTTAVVPLAAAMVAGSWSTAIAVAPPAVTGTGTVVGALDGLSCEVSRLCTAVGQFGLVSDDVATTQPLVATLTSGQWTTATGPVPTDAVTSDANDTANGAVCFAASSCVAVGAYLTSAGTEGYTVTPTTAPGAPTGVTAKPSNGAVTVTWTAPSYVGGVALSGYTASASPGGATCTTSSTSCTLTGLTNGTTYSISVVATNAVGSSVASSIVRATPITRPSAPTITTVTSLRGGLQLTFTPPASNGGATITTYEFSLGAGTHWRARQTGTTSHILTITGLARHHQYEVRVRAVNAAGPGQSSKAVSATTS